MSHEASMVCLFLAFWALNHLSFCALAYGEGGQFFPSKDCVLGLVTCAFPGGPILLVTPIVQVASFWIAAKRVCGAIMERKPK